MTTDTHKLKGIQSQISKIESEIELDKIQISTSQKQLNNKKKRLNELREMAKSLATKKELIVSEHAILRYLERVKGICLNDIIDQIKNEEVMSIYNKLGNSGKYPCCDFTAVVKNNVIVTIET